MTELAVNVPTTDDRFIDPVTYEDDAERAQAMVNSPKQEDGALNFQADDGDGMGMSLNLGDEDDIEDDPNKVTPNTKQRDQMGINSPRNKQKAGWGDSSGVAGLVTQVKREDENSGGGSGVESLVTQVSRDDGQKRYDDDNTSQDIASQQAQSGGMCACLSCLWSCCSGPQPPAAVPMQSHDTDEVQQAKKAETANSSLLATASTGNGEGKASQGREDSLSSTVYDTNLLPPLAPEHVGKKCLVLDLDETLVHSSFKPIPKPDFIIPVEIDRVVHHVYVLKRPYVDEFLLRASKHYELVIFTASLSKYADPLLDKLDVHKVLKHRLFRESCVISGTAYVKDLRKLNRKLKDTIIVDNSPPSYLFQPANAVPIASWFDDQSDTQLLDFCPVIETTMKDIPDVRCLLDANNKSFRWLCNQANQPVENYTKRNDKMPGYGQ